MKLTTREMTHIALGTSLLGVGALLKIPSPVAEYFTLQLPFLILIGIVMGPRKASYSALLYMLGGLAGIPWFASGGGFMYIVRPTFGFIVSFIFAAYIAGLGSASKSPKRALPYSVFASVFVWVFGMIYYTFIVRTFSGSDFTYKLALIGILSPDFYTDILLTIGFTYIGFRVKNLLPTAYDRFEEDLA